MDWWGSGSRGRQKVARTSRGDLDGAATIMGPAMSTRMLILLAALCAVVILAASAIQILIAR